MTQKTALPAGYSRTYLTERNTDGKSRAQVRTFSDKEQDANPMRRLTLEQLYGAAAAAVTYGKASIKLTALATDPLLFTRYFKCISIGNYLLTDDAGHVFNVAHRKPDDLWSLLTTDYGWINQEYINRKLSQQSNAA